MSDENMDEWLTDEDLRPENSGDEDQELEAMSARTMSVTRRTMTKVEGWK